MAEDLKKISTYLCYILRHCPEEIGNTHEVMDIHGWVNVDTLIKGVNNKGKFHITKSILEKIVADGTRAQVMVRTVSCSRR